MQTKIDKIIESTIALTINWVWLEHLPLKSRNQCRNGTLFHHFPSKKRLIGAAYLAVQKDLAWPLVGILDKENLTSGKVGGSSISHIAFGNP